MEGTVVTDLLFPGSAQIVIGGRTDKPKPSGSSSRLRTHNLLTWDSISILGPEASEFLLSSSYDYLGCGRRRTISM